eukprot:13129721-Alexandrium_andersonii.AAC.1
MRRAAGRSGTPVSAFGRAQGGRSRDRGGTGGAGLGACRNEQAASRAGRGARPRGKDPCWSWAGRRRA